MMTEFFLPTPLSEMAIAMFHKPAWIFGGMHWKRFHFLLILANSNKCFLGSPVQEAVQLRFALNGLKSCDLILLDAIMDLKQCNIGNLIW